MQYRRSNAKRDIVLGLRTWAVLQPRVELLMTFRRTRAARLDHHVVSAGYKSAPTMLITSGVVLVVATQPALRSSVAATGWLLPVLLPPECGEVEPVVGPDEQLAAVSVRRVGLKDAVSDSQEGTHTMTLDRPLDPSGCP